MSRVKASVEEGEIVISDAAGWRVSYRHSPASNALVATQVVTDAKAKVSERAVFLADAFQAATNQARKLGWIV